MKTEHTLGFVGLGSLGGPIARNLLRIGYSLLVYDKDPQKCQDLATLGATPVSRPCETVTPGGIVLSLVPDDDAQQVITTSVDGILSRLGPQGIHLSLSTISVGLTEHLSVLYPIMDCHYVAAPVGEDLAQAETGDLSIFFAGPQEAREKILPILKVLGHPARLHDLGERAASAIATKLAFDYNVPLAIMALAQASALAEGYGVPRERFLSILLASPDFQGGVYQKYGKMLVQGDFQAGHFPVSLGIKEIAMAIDAASLVGQTLPAARLFLNYLHAAVAEGWETADWGVVGRVIGEGGLGLPFVEAALRR